MEIMTRITQTRKKQRVNSGLAEETLSPHSYPPSKYALIDSVDAF
jgi:hypothetical protein